ncbi:MAG: hypothetical protein U5N26_08750 [Candidatus Marinimicrobia bacterium]|nr:hypothetical protein [Candidatus Neomarinimicrobiota bacterium]
MSSKISSIIGMPISNFLKMVEENNVLHVRKARLIPVYKTTDEMSLTSIFLSSLRLINEFKKAIFSELNLTLSGKLYVFTEVNFLETKVDQPDGLIIIVRSNKIKDAALLEVKNKNNCLNEEQINRYLDIAKNFKIPKLITISNQFVSRPTQTPLNIKPPSNVKMYHLSWSYILTIANILLYDNDLNIEDPDQVEIMKEVVSFLEHDVSGVTGFTVMKPGWKNVVDKIRSGSLLNKNDSDVFDTVTSWLQEERDMALILSRKLGSLVKTGIPKYRNDLQARITAEINNLIKSKALTSVLHIQNAASDIYVCAFFERRQIIFEVRLSPPEDKTNRGKIGWIRHQIQRCQKKNHDIFNEIENDLALYVYIKYQKEPMKFNINELEDAWEEVKDMDIKELGIRQEINLARTFESRKKIVEEIEKSLISYYEGVVQHLKEWVKPPPKVIEKKLDNNDLDSIE